MPVGIHRFIIYVVLFSMTCWMSFFHLLHYLILFSTSALSQPKWLFQLKQYPIPLWFPLVDIIITIDAAPSHVLLFSRF